MFSAERTRSAVICTPKAHPTTLRLQASVTTARYKNPSQVGTYVISATHSSLVSLATNTRLTRSGAGRWRLFRSVVTHQARRRLTPWIRIARMRRAMRLRLAMIPVSANSARMRGMPYVSSLARWALRMCSLKTMFACARLLSGRSRQS